MAHTLVLQIPDEVYQPLAQKAKKSGVTPEKLAVEWLAVASHLGWQDPVENFIGAFSSNRSDWADQHDKYLGQALLDQQEGKGKQ